MLLALLLAATPAGAAREVRLLMGTTAEVAVRGLAVPGPALDAAFAALVRVDDAMSLWKESELTRLNRVGAASVSPDLLAVVRHALAVAVDSDGAFDPTVEPLLRAAGQYGDDPHALPEAERATLLARVGWRRVHLDAAGSRLRLEPGTRLDLGGIAKGYAVDLALAALRGAGGDGGLVDLGGSSIGTFGQELDLDVRDPEGAGPPWASFHLASGHVSTSGGDQRPGHILDPRAGRAASRVLAASVVAASGIEADALSTAVFVRGAEEGFGLLARRGAAGLVLEREAGKAIIRTTPGFARAHRLVARPGVEVRE